MALYILKVKIILEMPAALLVAVHVIVFVNHRVKLPSLVQLPLHVKQLHLLLVGWFQVKASSLLQHWYY